MKYEIETYKGQTIEYDDELDKFVCDISVEDKSKSTKRQSLKDVKKEIDSFIKLNLDFKPFKFLSDSGYQGIVVKEAVALRTDGKLVVKSHDGRRTDHEGKFESYDKKEIIRYKYDPGIIEAIKDMNKEAEDLRKAHEKRMKELKLGLVALDLSKYDLK